jgi:NAD(P)-dependent dehydrogenase (short-subunit alcohol dehydrogenase family)
MEMSLQGKILAVTGGASGIGLATAMLAARSGAAGIVLADCARDRLATAVDAVRAEGCLVEALTIDVTTKDGADEITARAVDRFGRLDSAVNAAGVEGGIHPLDACDDAEFDAVMSVNLWGVFRCMRAQLRQMYQQQAGSIVNIASASVFGVHHGLGAYVASKAAVLTLSKVAAKEAGSHGVRVNALCPGLTDTPMLRESLGTRPLTSDIAGSIALGRIGTAAEIAEAAVWLCSDRSAFTTGVGLVVDGGRTG